jgi:phosphomannomutase/phosphoglucomutase
VEVGRKKVEAAMKAVERQAKGEAERIDGVKLWTGERSWVLIRPSGTEPIVRIFGEAETQEAADQLVKKFEKIVKAASA